MPHTLHVALRCHAQLVENVEDEIANSYAADVEQTKRVQIRSFCLACSSVVLECPNTAAQQRSEASVARVTVTPWHVDVRVELGPSVDGRHD